VGHQEAVEAAKVVAVEDLDPMAHSIQEPVEAEKAVAVADWKPMACSVW
jgi:hypothetical protein